MPSRLSRTIESLAVGLALLRTSKSPGVRGVGGRKSPIFTPAAMHRAAAGVNIGLVVGRKRVVSHLKVVRLAPIDREEGADEMWGRHNGLNGMIILVTANNDVIKQLSVVALGLSLFPLHNR